MTSLSGLKPMSSLPLMNFEQWRGEGEAFPSPPPAPNPENGGGVRVIVEAA